MHGNRETFSVFSGHGGGVSAEGMATKNKNQRGLASETSIEGSQSRVAFTVAYLVFTLPYLAIRCH